MKKVKLADVLWDAANERLWAGCGRYEFGKDGTWQYSCDAVTTQFDPVLRTEIKRFLIALGCDTESIELFTSYAGGRQRQGVRYMWLLLAMHVAEDENLEIEVSQC
jgi:hypothetical protein